MDAGGVKGGRTAGAGRGGKVRLKVSRVGHMQVAVGVLASCKPLSSTFFPYGVKSIRLSQSVSQ